MRVSPAVILGSAATILATSGCAPSPQPAKPPVPSDLAPVALPFQAVVGTLPFACGTTYEGLGATRTAVTPSDLRLFVSDVSLIGKDGRVVALASGPERVWEHEGTTLLDFENGTGPCANGSAALNTTVEGRAPAGEYIGVRFTIGVPFAMNHLDHNRQPSPLNTTSMFWAWRSGYKFLRFDYRAEGPGGAMFLHLGSTGCVVDSAVSPLTRDCGQGNRAIVELRNLALGRDPIVLDVAELLRGVNLEANQPQTARGCMSAQNDADCAPIFANLGIPFAASAPAQQRVFRIGRAEDR